MAKAKKPTDGAKTPRKPRAKKEKPAPTILDTMTEDERAQFDADYTERVLSDRYGDDGTTPKRKVLTKDENSIQGAPIADNLLGPSEFIPKQKHQVGLGWFPGMDPEKRFRLLKHFEEHGNFGNLLPEHQTPGKTEPSEPTQFPSKALTTLLEGEANRERTEGHSTKDIVSNTREAGTQEVKHSETTTQTDADDGSKDTAHSNQTPQADTEELATIAGDEIPSVAETTAVYSANTLESLPLARARYGETRKQCWERLRQEARTAGMTRRDAISYAGRMVDQVWIAPPEPDPEPTEAPPEPEPAQPEPAAPTIVDKLDDLDAPTTVDKPPADQGVSGLGEIPADWPQLPANAQLQVEIAWVSANRLRVRSGHGVDLSRALSPAPSYSALSWLETSILFPSKFADISVKATASQDDEKEHIRREKMAIEEIRGLLAEMLE